MTAKPKTFDQILALYIKHQALTMTYARQLADMAIEHFSVHGNLTLAQRFHDAIEENYGRRVAFVAWMQAFSPTLYEKGKLNKDKTEDAVEFDVEKAKAVAFWEFAPEIKATTWTGPELIEALNRVIKTHEGSSKKKRQPANEIAVRTLENAKRVIATIAVPVEAALEQTIGANVNKTETKIEAKVKADAKASVLAAVNA